MNERFPSRRSVVHSAKGIAASTQPLASAAAVKILEQGGNAADAAVAMAAAIGVTEPMMTGIGGDVFVLYYDAKTKTVQGLNGSGKSAKSLTLDKVKAALGNDEERIPPTNGLAVNVPGAAAGWTAILDKWGTPHLSLLQILKPAIELAEGGFPVSKICSEMWAEAEEKLKASPNGHELLNKDAKAPKEGELFYNRNLAEIYMRLARYGRDGFYSGPTAESIVEAVGSAGGALSMEDFSTHKSLFIDPLQMPVDNEVTLHELPPNNHGLVALLAMGILSKLAEKGIVDFSKIKHNSPEYIHVVVEALKFAFKDADHYIGDPEMRDFDLKDILSSKFIDSRASLFAQDKVNLEYEHGTIDPARSSDTSYFTVADKEGNACSIISSVYHSFGSGIIPKGSGFALHNRASNFYLREGSRNSFEGGKRPYHTIIPAMLTKGSELFSSYGVMGAFMQPQGHVQIAYNLRYFGLDPQQSLDAPRFCICPDPDDGGIPANKGVLVCLEEGVPTETADKLRALGHKVTFISGSRRCIFGRGQVILHEVQNGQHVYHAGSDLRGDGSAIPQI